MKPRSTHSTAPRHSEQSRAWGRRAGVLALSVALAGALFWLFQPAPRLPGKVGAEPLSTRASSGSGERAERAQSPEAEAQRPALVGTPVERGRQALAPAAAPPKPAVLTSREQRSQRDTETYDPATHPHPITSEHRRLYRENRILGALDGAILVQDVAGIRRLNATYRREYPEDDHVLQDAYEMIADCLEDKTPERVERARRFWETRRSSQARRDLRRACLE